MEQVVEGQDYIGIGVGAMIFNAKGEVLLAKRGSGARNERGFWEFPGGGVNFGERLEDAVRREIKEEYGIEIKLDRLLCVFDHILKLERQHWISITFIAHLIGGVPAVAEPEKCSAIGWFSLTGLPDPLSQITKSNLNYYLADQ
jgi:8-oxo-dGTP diphosphatase